MGTMLIEAVNPDRLGLEIPVTKLFRKGLTMKWDKEMREAIKNLHILRVQYESFRAPALMVEPHAYGLREGVASVLAWDRSHIDDYDWEHGWLWLELDRVLLADETGGRFGGARRGYRHDMRALDPIYAQI